MSYWIGNVLSGVTSQAVSSFITNDYNKESPTREIIKKRLDPLSFLAVIASLKYYPIDTKIHLSVDGVKTSHSNDYRSCGLNLRGISRSFTGDSREDLAVIRPAIKTVAAWHQLHAKESREIREFMSHVSLGISALQETYKHRSSITSDALEFYISKIKYYEEHEPVLNTELNEVTKKIKDLWDKQEIHQLNLQLNRMKQTQGTTPIQDKVLCRDEITVFNTRINAKFQAAKKIYN